MLSIEIPRFVEKVLDNNERAALPLIDRVLISRQAVAELRRQYLYPSWYFYDSVGGITICEIPVCIDNRLIGDHFELASLHTVKRTASGDVSMPDPAFIRAGVDADLTQFCSCRGSGTYTYVGDPRVAICNACEKRM